MLSGPRLLFTCFLDWELRREHWVYGTPSEANINSDPEQHSRYLLTVCDGRGALLLRAVWGALSPIRQRSQARFYCSGALEELTGPVRTL